MKTHGKSFCIFLLLFVAAMCLACSGMVSAAELPASQTAGSLFQHSKIIDPERVLQSFAEGMEIARVIVNLSPPSELNDASAFGNHAWRQRLRDAVAASQDRVIRAMDPWDVQITNRFTYVYGFSAEVTLEGLEELVNAPDVVSVEEDRILHAHLAQGIPLMDATVPRISYGGAGVAVAICDTGIDYTHPRLGAGGFPNSKVIGGYDCGDNDRDPMDQQGHGTACAGIAAGNLGTVGDYIGGVAYDAKLYAVKISYGSGGSASTGDMIEAWEWCITHQDDDPNNPILIISTSFGGGRHFSTCDSDTPAMTAAAANAAEAGITIFVSSGNDGYCESMGWPACISHVVSVGAVYDANLGQNPPSGYVGCIAEESCTGNGAPWYCGYDAKWYVDEPANADQVTTYSNTAPFLSVLAPSNWATTTRRGGGYWNVANGFGGTSAASPYAAGAAACLQSASLALNGVFLSPAQVKSTLISTGDPITDGKVSITKPRVNLGAAVDSLGGGCTYSIDPAQTSVGLEGGPGSVAVTTQSGCSWTALSNHPDWLHVTSGSSGAGSGPVGYSVDRNEGPARTGTLTIAGKTFTVEQAAGGECTYAIDPVNAAFDLRGGRGSASVTAPSGCSWTAVSNVDWIRIRSGESGTGNGALDYDVARSRTPRTGTLTIAGQTFTVNQGTTPCTYGIDPTQASVAAGSGSGSVGVTTQEGCSWTAVSNHADWLHVTSGSSGTGSGTVGYSADENTGAARVGTIAIAGQTFIVNQEGTAPCTYGIDPTQASVGAEIGAGSVVVTTQAGCSWTAVSNHADWLHVTSGASGAESGMVEYSVDENTGAARTGTLTIGGKTFTVDQAAGGGGCAYAIDPVNAAFDLRGGRGSVAVSATPGCSWTAVSQASWIRIRSGQTGVGNGAVTYDVVRSRSSRTGTMTIAGETFTVNQE